MELRGELLCLCVLALVGTGWAARRVDAKARARDTMKRRREATVMNRQEPGPLDTTELLQLTEGESLDEVRTVTDAHGTKIERLQEKYKGIPVFDSTVTVRKDDKGHLTGDASGQIVQDISEDLPDIEPEITDEEALQIVIEAEGDENILDSIGDIEHEHFVFLDSQDRAQLVSKVSYMIDGVKKPVYLIDLKTSEVLMHWNSFMTIQCCNKSPLKVKLIGGNEKMGKVTYGSQPYCLDFTVDDCNVCHLENKYVRVVDMQFTDDENITATASFPCDAIYNDTVNGAYSPMIDAFFHGTVVGKMFEEWYGETALRDKMIIRVHFKRDYQNAFWNSVNATLGDGAFMFYPLTSMDIVGHEFGHGVVEQGSNLYYFGESGGMNEAFADIMGEATESFFQSSDYLTGNTVMKTQPYLREFENPENDNSSISRADQMTDDLDSHYSSGVYRRLWYVLTKEEGMDIKDAFGVFIYANKMYWHYMSSFYDGACGLLKAAMDLGADTAPFLKAFDDVGISKCNVSDHIVSLTNNRTQKGVHVSESTQPVFAFSAPDWAESIYVEAISPSLGKINITVLKGSWEEEEYDQAQVVATGTTMVKYIIDDDDEESFFWKRGYESSSSSSYTPDSNTDIHGSTTDSYNSEPTSDSYGTASDSYGQDTTTGSSGQDTTTGSYRNDSSSVSYVGASTDSYGQDTTTGSYGQDTTTGSQGHGTTADSYGATITSYGATTDNYGAANTTDNYGAANTTDNYGAANTTDNYGAANTTDNYGYTTGNYENTTGGYNTTDGYNYTTTEATPAVEHKFWIKLNTIDYWDSLRDVEVTAGYVCKVNYKPSDSQSFMFYLYQWYCKE